MDLIRALLLIAFVAVAASPDEGTGIDPFGRSAATADAGCGIDPNG